VRRIAWIIIFPLIFLAGDRVIAFLLDKVVLQSGFRFSILYRGGQQYDMLILGNSRGVNSFYAPAVQEATGRTTLNLSYNGMSADLAEALFMDYLDRNRKPKLLILEISNVAHKSDLLTELKLYTTHSERLSKLFRKANPEAAFWAEASRVFQFNGEMFLRTLYYLNASDQSWINRYRIGAAMVRSVREGQQDELGLLPENLDALRHIIETARQKGIAVRLVIGPYLPQYRRHLSNLSGWVKTVQSVATDVPIWDYSMAVEEAASFADRLHLNYDGSLLLLKRLRQDGFFALGREPI
jgi:hypothetical protein